MAKVIISFLGTGGYKDKDTRSKGEYRDVSYSIDNSEYKSQYVADVLKQHYNADRIICIGTVKSMWDGMYNKFVSDDPDSVWEKLYTFSENSSHKTEITKADFIHDIFKDTLIDPVLIKYGLNKEENEFNIMQLFKIEKLLKNGDELYIDITHGFRSMPIVLVNVLSFLVDNMDVDVKIAKISYGMFEVSHEMGGTTPVVDLDIINELNATVKASHEFIEYGNSILFSRLLEKVNKSLSNTLSTFSFSRGMNHIDELMISTQRLKGAKFEGLSFLNKYMIDKSIKKYLSYFDRAEHPSHYQLEIGRWCLSNGLYGYSVICFQEATLTKLCEKYDLDSSQINRKIVKELLQKRFGYRSKRNRIIKDLVEEWNKYEHGKPQYISYILSGDHYDSNSDIRKIYLKLRDVRDSVAHALKTEDNSKKMVNLIDKRVEGLKKFVYG
jgi:CRISPR-associated Csx2 family protein